MQGFVYLHRKLLLNPVFKNPHLLKVWIWCLLKASHAKHDVLVGRQNVTLEPGQFIFGRNAASIELDMSPTRIRDYMLSFKSLQMLDIKSNNKYSLVTIINWALYQTYNKNSDSNLDNKRTADGQQMDTNNNGNTGDTDNTGFKNKNENDNAPCPGGQEGVTVQEKREPHDPTVDNAIGYYFKTYLKKCHRQHPILKPEQWQRVRDNLKAYQDENDLDDERWETLIDYHYGRNIETDWNIQHFATDGIIQNAFYKTLY